MFTGILRVLDIHISFLGGLGYYVPLTSAKKKIDTKTTQQRLRKSFLDQNYGCDENYTVHRN